MIIIPEHYTSTLDRYQTQTAIGYIKYWFEQELKKNLNLKRVSAPLFVESDTGLNDDLTGNESPVSFSAPALLGQQAEVVHSLAKWKRMALYRYDFRVENGLYADMNAIRQHETLSNIHSLYVDQWDWERVIDEQSRTIEYLKKVVQDLADAIYHTHQQVIAKYPTVSTKIERGVFFISSQELDDLYPQFTDKEKEHAITKKHRTVFIYQIGKKLNNGQVHDFRAPDYDDWDLNGDLLYYHELLDISIEISSMGIRVNDQSLLAQLTESDTLNRLDFPFHQAIMSGVLPQSIGGGLGQSRMCMLLLGKAHIGEVQVSIWDQKTKAACEGVIELL